MRGHSRSATLRAMSVGVLLSASVASAAPQRAVTSLLEMRHDGVVLQAWDLSCGAAALATLLALQHDDHVSEREIATALMRRPEYLANPQLVRVREGFSLLDLKRYVRARGYEGAGLGKLRLEDLAKVAPLITPLSVNGYNHFVVVRGMRDGRVLVADPAFGNREMTAENFAAAWIADPTMGHLGFVVRKPPPPPVPPQHPPKARRKQKSRTH